MHPHDVYASCHLVGSNVLASADERCLSGRQYGGREAGGQMRGAELVDSRAKVKDTGVLVIIRPFQRDRLSRLEGDFPAGLISCFIHQMGRGKNEHAAAEVNLKGKNNRGPKEVDEID